MPSQLRGQCGVEMMAHFFLPRWGTGARKGQSVSMRRRSSGINLAVSLNASAFLKVTIPENEMLNPNLIDSSASSEVPVKQCMTPVLLGIPTFESEEKRSWKASRQ